MEGDLSLSESLGGLRIANPDDDDDTASTQSPPREADYTGSIPQRSSSNSYARTRSSSRHSTQPFPPFQQSPPTSMPLDPNPSSRTPASVPYTATIPPLAPQDQVSSRSSRIHPSSSSASSRPMSSTYPHTPAMAASAPGVTDEGSYRLQSESSRSSTTGYPTRSDSRGGSAALQAGVPSREHSYSDRTYRQGQPNISGNGPLPPRRSSRGMPPPQYGVLAVGNNYRADTGLPSSSEEWKERGATTVVQQEVDRNGNAISKITKKGVKDFNFGRTLGEGSYSTVLAATDRQTLHEYAIKVLDKRHIIKEKKVKYVNIEKDTLNRLGAHPGIVRLYYTFQDEKSLYYVLDLASGGELLGVLKRMSTFDVECTRYYAAQILDAVAYMHSQGVIHRDLKPENVLLDDQMHVKITDFGTAKILQPPQPKTKGNGPNIPFAADGPNNDDRASSFVGTAEYVSPELLSDKNACKASDLWAFGCIVYQLLAGRPPFKAANEYLTFQKIVALDYEFPKGFPPIAQDLVERLLVLDPAKRLSIEHIKNHEFFDGVKWDRSLWTQRAPRLRPYVPSNDSIVINLNGYSTGAPSPNVPSSSSKQIINGGSRPQPRVITELPPPSQLDIDWSPVLTKTNERILKLGNLVVVSGPAIHPSEGGVAEPSKKLSRFFGGNGLKKRQRLVMITSGARVIMAAPGGEEKKSKSEISLLAPGVSIRITKDSKGGSCWCIDTVSRHSSLKDKEGRVLTDMNLA